MKMPLAALAACLAAGPLALFGCYHRNDLNDLGDGIILPALALDPPIALPVPNDPSVTSLDRRNWEPVNIVVPIYGVAHGPTYTTNHRRTDTTARQRAEHPTALTALELDGGTCGTQVREAAEAPFVAAWDALLLLPRAVVTRPWTELRGGQEPYWRSSVFDARIAPNATSGPVQPGVPAERPSDQLAKPVAEPVSLPPVDGEPE